jgi:hypothetical protein
MLRRLRKGQSTAEYAIVIGLVIAAAVAMQVYVKRSIQGKMKDATDYNDPAATMLTTQQYEPQYATNDGITSTRNVQEQATTTQGGGITRAIQGEDTSSRTGVSHISGTN